ncbi:MAG TPA: hypothetical protein VF992_01605 [Thermoplasmata archaeon]
MHVRLEQLRSYIRWTAPLYVLFLAAGLVAAQFVFGSSLAILVGLLAVFGTLDAALLSRIRRIEASEIRDDADLRTTRAQIERLARLVLAAGAGLGVAFVVLFVWMVVRA